MMHNNMNFSSVPNLVTQRVYPSIVSTPLSISQTPARNIMVLPSGLTTTPSVSAMPGVVPAYVLQPVVLSKPTALGNNICSAVPSVMPNLAPHTVENAKPPQKSTRKANRRNSKGRPPWEQTSGKFKIVLNQKPDHRIKAILKSANNGPGRGSAPIVQKYKTEICKNWIHSGGKCCFGNSCIYAHGEKDIRDEEANLEAIIANAKPNLQQVLRQHLLVSSTPSQTSNITTSTTSVPSEQLDITRSNSLSSTAASTTTATTTTATATLATATNSLGVFSETVTLPLVVFEDIVHRVQQLELQREILQSTLLQIIGEMQDKSITVPITTSVVNTEEARIATRQVESNGFQHENAKEGTLVGEQEVEVKEEAEEEEEEEEEEEDEIDGLQQIAVPAEFCCPLTSNIMIDPVVVSSTGNYFERSAIIKWIQEKGTEPITGSRTALQEIIPDPELQGRIQQWSVNQSVLFQTQQQQQKYRQNYTSARESKGKSR